MEFTCPKCNEKTDIETVATIPDEQRFILELKKTDGFEGFSARTIGGVITANEKLLKATAKECGQSVSVFVSNFTLTSTVASIEFLIVRNKSKNE